MPDFQRYLESKRSVDDRALNRWVWEALAAQLPTRPAVVEFGCGTGAMLARMRSHGLLAPADPYLGVDADPENIAVARSGQWEGRPAFVCADLYDVQPDGDRDLLVAAALLDLLDLDRALPHLHRFLRPGGLAYLPIHFDGVTIFEPAHPQDSAILHAYHASMDSRPTRGDSRTGRKLFTALPAAGFEILAAGASDWVVHPGPEGRYPADEAFFLRHILSFFESSCAGEPGLEEWLSARRGQVEAGELVYIAHQFDFLARR